MGRTRHTIISGVALSTLALAACGADQDDTSADEAPADERAAELDFGEFEAPADDAAVESRTGGIESTGLELPDFGRDVITEVSLTMTTDDVGATVDDIRRLTGSTGGAVFSSDVSVQPALGDGTVPGGGTLTIRIPPQDLDRLIDALDGLGGVTRLTQDSQDVTDQLIDLNIRIRQAQSGIERIEQILADTTELDDLFAVENELNRRQVELERLLASERSTEDRVALATLTIEVRYAADAPAAVPDEDPGIADAFGDGWNAFLGALFAIGFVLAVLAPFLGLAAVIGGLTLLVTRRLRRPGSAPRRGARPADTDTQTGTVDVDVDVDGRISESVDEPSPTT